MLVGFLRFAPKPEPHQPPFELCAHIVLAHGANGRMHRAAAIQFQ
jgi:hypothetical protein